ncbi:MAG: potassium channel protein [Spirulinaceae cyanobacterium SM2_1_0]|nr:potassium channel protein [Spirulinaceae cyanobacterium SM2_1_0]
MKIIVTSLGRTGYKIFTLLRQQGIEVIGIGDRPLPGEKGDDVILGDARSEATLLAAGIRTADTVLLTGNDDALNLAVLTQARALNPNIRIINRLFNHILGERLDRTLTNHVSMSVSSLAAPIFAFAAQGNQAIGQLQLFDQTWPIHEEVIHERHPWYGRSLSDLWTSRSRMLIHYAAADCDCNLVAAVVGGRQLAAGDRLIVGTKPVARYARQSRLRRLLKTLSSLHKFQRYGRPVALVSLALLATIFLATLTYIWANYDTSLVDALYFSVGMITGAGGQEQVAEMAPDSIKVFTTIMMVVGAGVIGICYALINDFILGSHLKQFWAAARVPTRNHYIVCGLGGVGIRIAEQLYNQGCETVIVERDANNRFLHEARSLGIPVIVEDASLASTLRAANAETAAALLAVTSGDTINVEIALCAKAVQPQLPIVVRNQDPKFSLSVQQVFGFDNVLCPNELATPAFAAAALGGRILGNGMMNDVLWVAIATLITPTHPFCHRTVQEAAQVADFVPLYLEIQDYTVHGWELLTARLQPNDRLYLTMPATELARLWSGSSALEYSSRPTIDPPVASPQLVK